MATNQTSVAPIGVRRAPAGSVARDGADAPRTLPASCRLDLSVEGGGLASRLAALPLRGWRWLCSAVFEARLIYCLWDDQREKPVKSWWKRNVCDDAPDGV